MQYETNYSPVQRRPNWWIFFSIFSTWNYYHIRQGMSDNIQSAIEFENIFYDFWKCENQKREVHVKLQPEIVGQFFKTQLCLFQTLLSLSYQTTTKSWHSPRTWCRTQSLSLSGTPSCTHPRTQSENIITNWHSTLEVTLGPDINWLDLLRKCFFIVHALHKVKQ